MARSKEIKAHRLKIGRPGLAKFLGNLEAVVMDKIWARHGATVKEIWNEMVDEAQQRKQHPPAYTTILTVMQNLEKKGLLVSERIGKQNFYTPCCSKKDFLKKSVRATIEELLKDFPDYVLATLLPDENAHLSQEEIEVFRKVIDQKLKQNNE